MSFGQNHSHDSVCVTYVWGLASVRFGGAGDLLRLRSNWKLYKLKSVPSELTRTAHE